MNGCILDSIVTFETLDEATSGYVQVSGVTFRTDFGPWKVGQIVDSIALDYEASQLVEYDSKGNRVKEWSVKLAPVP